ncbi:MAG: formate dehydrogenase [Pseudomonadales bacterium]|nr:formate dehydrogenase [Pseudomonadales bacterium]
MNLYETYTVFIPGDSAAVALGANLVAEALLQEANKRCIDIRLIRNGSRGMIWAEPLLEIQTSAGRLAFACTNPEILVELLDTGIFERELDMSVAERIHPSCLGFTEDIPWLKNQNRQTFSRCGIINPLCLDDYQTLGGLSSLKNALEQQPNDIIDAIAASGLRGRGGAAFPAGIKWKTVAECSSPCKYIVCNADEGDSGTYADRLIMEGDPFLLIESMAIAGYATGANKGYIYLRSEYPLARQILDQAIRIAQQKNLLGDSILGSEFNFDIQLFVGAGAYICGEETSLLQSLEGKRGEVRSKPPLPAQEGLFGQPTLIHNVISLCSVPAALVSSGQHYAALGINRSLGTLPFQLSGNIKYAGLVELAFGHSLRYLLDQFGQGTLSGKPLRAVQIGGPLGAYLPDRMLDTNLDYEEFIAIGAGIGHGGIVVFDDTVNLQVQARYAFQFCVEESCGKCTPCRIGAKRGLDNLSTSNDLVLVEALCEVMESGSLCAMGGMTPIPVRSAIHYFPEDFTPTELVS